MSTISNDLYLTAEEINAVVMYNLAKYEKLLEEYKTNDEYMVILSERILNMKKLRNKLIAIDRAKACPKSAEVIDINEARKHNGNT